MSKIDWKRILGVADYSTVNGVYVRRQLEQAEQNPKLFGEVAKELGYCKPASRDEILMILNNPPEVTYGVGENKVKHWVVVKSENLADVLLGHVAKPAPKVLSEKGRCNNCGEMCSTCNGEEIYGGE